MWLGRWYGTSLSYLFLFIVWLSHWTSCLLCISQRCIYHWTNGLLCGSATDLTVFFYVFRSDVSTIKQTVYCVAQPLNKLFIMYLAVMYQPLNKCFIMYLAAMYLHLNKLFLVWLSHWKNCLLCILQRCIYHWTNCLFCGSATKQTVYYVSRSDVSTIEQTVYFVAQPLKKLLLCISQRCIYHWTDCLSCILDQCINWYLLDWLSSLNLLITQT